MGWLTYLSGVKESMRPVVILLPSADFCGALDGSGNR